MTALNGPAKSPLGARKDAFDPPAAHSMDTSWYAVDADGNIGLFDSGEDGGVPNDSAIACGEMADDGPMLALDRLRVARRLVRLTEDELSGARPNAYPAPEDGEHVVLRVRESAREALDYRRERRTVAEALLGEPIVLSEVPRVLGSRGPLDETTIAELVAAEIGLVVREHEFSEWLYDGEDGEELLFLFHHGEADGHEGPGAYLRSTVPAEPLTLRAARAAAVSEDEREQLNALENVTFPASFAQTERLHLADTLAEDAVSRWGEVDLRGTYTEDLAEARAVRQEQAEQQRKQARRFVLGIFVFVFLLVSAVVWSERRRHERRPKQPTGVVYGTRTR